MMFFKSFASFLALAFIAGGGGLAVLPDAVAGEGAPRLPAGYQLLYEQDFSSAAALGDFVATDTGAWRWAAGDDQDQRSTLELFRQSQYEPAVRSPVNMVLLADRLFDDFILEVELKQTGREYGHRDMCLFFGVQDPTHFYYAHLATKADDHAHNVFIVNGAPRTKIAHQTTAGVHWGLEQWHRVRLERKASEGTIKVYFDDLTTPIMAARDDRFKRGAIGLGSFDDTGKVTALKIWGPSVEEKKTEFFRRFK